MLKTLICRSQYKPINYATINRERETTCGGKAIKQQYNDLNPKHTAQDVQNKRNTKTTGLKTDICRQYITDRDAINNQPINN